MKRIIRSALLSVYDKTNLIALAEFLVRKNIQIISSGGTAKALEAAGIPCTLVENFTQYAENFGGRMKTISFQISSGILYRRDNIEDELEVSRLGIPHVDLVVCNFYPFKAVCKNSKNIEEVIEEVDIGGPLMVRTAAKNFQAVSVLTSSSEYASFMQHYDENDGTNLDYRKDLAYSAFQYLHDYDQAIINTFQRDLNLENAKTLRYGENPHQDATWKSKNNIKMFQGKELSYNNLLDLDVALKVVSDATLVVKDQYPFVACIIKHGNPCGFSAAKNAMDALAGAWKGDEISSFGSIIGINFPLTDEVLEFFNDKFVEAIISPKIAANLNLIKKSVRIIESELLLQQKLEMTSRSFFDGDLIQNEDQLLLMKEKFEVVTLRDFPMDKFTLAQFGIIAVKYLKSNAIALVHLQNDCLLLLSSGMGQPNRLDSLKRLAIPKAQEKNADLKECILISDAFFPFDDCLRVAGEFGIKFIVQPGGSIKDSEVIATANELDMSMVFTGVRHFRH